jgi:DNA polymerase I
MLLRMQLIDADYFVNNNKPVLRFFGKTADGVSACVFYDKLLPYFYIKLTQAMTVDKALEKMEDIKEIKDVNIVEKILPYGYQTNKTKLLKLTLFNPQDVPHIREKVVTQGIAEDVFESDIMFKYRFMVDNRIYGMQWLEIDCEHEQKTIKSKVATYKANTIKPVDEIENAELRYLAFDIECISSDMQKPIDARNDPIVMISLAFNPEFRGKKTLVLVAKSFSGENTKGFSSEKEMLEEFLNIIDMYDPDIITGYNINSFDLPYLAERLKQNKLSLALGRSDKEIFSRTFGITQEFTISGRVVADPYQILKRDPWVKLHRYDLKTVAARLLGEEKLGVEYKEMSGLWSGDRQGLLRFIEYARKDAELSLKLVIEKGLLDKFFELSKISGLLLQDAFGGQTRRIETMMLHEFRDRGFVMPQAMSHAEINKRARERSVKELKGATVLEPKKGLHSEGCVLVLDFKSLYPSIMRTYNISPDTMMREKGDIKCHQSPSGAYFVDSSIYKGIFPDVLTRLIETRSDVKKAMKKASGEEKRILNAKQLALKDMSNSFYGYTGYIRARLYMIDVANSITAYGRENIEATRKLVEENFDVEVVYGDTDSIFVKTKITNLDEAKAYGEKISNFITEKLPGFLELEFEKIYRTFLILSKKRYAGWKFELTDNGWTDEIEMRGIETVRRDWCSLVSETMTDTLNIILKEGNVQKAIDTTKDILNKLRAGQIPLEKLTIIKGITQSLGSYKGVLPHIELARKLAIRNPYDAPKIGDRIGFVIIKGNNMLSKRAEDPAYVKEHGIQIDPDYYIDSQLFPPIERILSSLGIEKTEILGGGHQANLSDIFSGRKRKMKHDIEINYNHADATKAEQQETVLAGWDEFVCKKCSKSYRRMPLQGQCKCGGELQISFQGSTGDKISVK